MAQKTDETMPLADVYAESLVAAARERGQEDEVAEALADLVGYLDEHPDFEAFLVSGSVDDTPRRASLEKLFRGRMNDLLLNLLQVLNDRWRMGLIRAVQRCVELRMEAQHRQQEVEVETAMPLTAAQKAAIGDELGRHIGKEVILIERVDPDLIGGVVIHVGDMQVDASVASQVERARHRLIDRATEEIHSGRGYVAEA